MKYVILFIILTTLLIDCNQSANSNQLLQQRIDSLEKKLANSYTPGFGDFMSNMQVHHAKLWFAGLNKNWELATFEMHEITEITEDIKKYKADRTETEKLSMLDPVLDSIKNALQQQDSSAFKKGYVLLTNTCNDCHHAVKLECNVVKIPDTPPFSNQDFKLKK